MNTNSMNSISHHTALQNECTGNRKEHIEFMRIAACFLVIVNHTNSRIFSDVPIGKTYFFSLTYFFICKIAVPVFLLIMGALLLGKQDTWKKSFSRLSRIALVTFLFSVIYYIYYVHTGKFDAETAGFFDFIARIRSKPVSTALWYMYLYVGLLCILRFLQKMTALCSKQDLLFLLFMSLGIMGTIPFLHVLVPYQRLYSRLTLPIFSPYIGMVAAGYYIEKHMIITRRRFFLAGGIFAFLIAMQVIISYRLTLVTPGKYPLDDHTMITITGSAICFYIMVKYVFSQIHLPDAVCHALKRLGSLTFGIYLLSDLIKSLSLPVYQALCQHMHIMLAMLLWELFIFGVCAILSAGLKKIPYVKNCL